MILVDWQLKLLCERGFLKPFDPSYINPSSVDIRLGESVFLDTEEGYKEYDLKKYTPESPFLIKPNGFLLAVTYEFFNVPFDYCCELKLKSSRARERLSHALAGHVDNNFQGCLTLELKNYSPYHQIPIYYMQPIGQVIVHQTKKPEKPYVNSTYSNSTKPVASRYSPI